MSTFRMFFAINYDVFEVSRTADQVIRSL